jgi:uncharacterized protein DUF6788
VSENYRKCGKPNSACAQPDHRGHGPRFLWTRTARGRGTVGRQLAAGEVEKVRREVARYAEFAAISEQIAEAWGLRLGPVPPGSHSGCPSPTIASGYDTVSPAIGYIRWQSPMRVSGPISDDQHLTNAQSPSGALLKSMT